MAGEEEEREGGMRGRKDENGVEKRQEGRERSREETV